MDTMQDNLTKQYNDKVKAMSAAEFKKAAQ